MSGVWWIFFSETGVTSHDIVCFRLKSIRINTPPSFLSTSTKGHRMTPGDLTDWPIWPIPACPQAGARRPRRLPGCPGSPGPGLLTFVPRSSSAALSGGWTASTRPRDFSSDSWGEAAAPVPGSPDRDDRIHANDVRLPSAPDCQLSGLYDAHFTVVPLCGESAMSICTCASVAAKNRKVVVDPVYISKSPSFLHILLLTTDIFCFPVCWIRKYFPMKIHLNRDHAPLSLIKWLMCAFLKVTDHIVSVCRRPGFWHFWAVPTRWRFWRSWTSTAGLWWRHHRTLERRSAVPQSSARPEVWRRDGDMRAKDRLLFIHEYKHVGN